MVGNAGKTIAWSKSHCCSVANWRQVQTQLKTAELTDCQLVDESDRHCLSHSLAEFPSWCIKIGNASNRTMGDYQNKPMNQCSAMWVTCWTEQKQSKQQVEEIDSIGATALIAAANGPGSHSTTCQLQFPIKTSMSCDALWNFNLSKLANKHNKNANKLVHCENF